MTVSETGQKVDTNLTWASSVCGAPPTLPLSQRWPSMCPRTALRSTPRLALSMSRAPGTGPDRGGESQCRPVPSKPLSARRSSLSPGWAAFLAAGCAVRGAWVPGAGSQRAGKSPRPRPPPPSAALGPSCVCLPHMLALNLNPLPFLLPRSPTPSHPRPYLLTPHNAAAPHWGAGLLARRVYVSAADGDGLAGEHHASVHAAHPAVLAPPLPGMLCCHPRVTGCGPRAGRSSGGGLE